MRLEQLLYLEKIVEKGSINEAAKELFLTQPSISNAIKELESEMGVQLLLRNPRGVTLTEEGREFLAYSRQILDQVNLLEEKYKNKQLRKQAFSVSAQHYAFVVPSSNSFIVWIPMNIALRYEKQKLKIFLMT